MLRPGARLALLLVLACDGSSGTGWVTMLAPETVSKVVYQDGDAPWQTVERRYDVYRFEVLQGRYRLAYVCQRLQFAQVIQATVAELSAIEVECLPTGTTARVTGSITAAPAGAAIDVVVGRSGQMIPGAIRATEYEVSVTPGEHDLLAAAVAPSGETRVLIKRGLMLTGPTVVDLDFGDALVARLQPVSVTGAPPGAALQVHVTLTSARGARLSYPSPPGQAALLDPTALAGDSQTVSVSTPFSSGDVRQSVIAFEGSLPIFALPPSQSMTAEVLIDGDSRTRVRVGFPRSPPVTYYELLANATQALRLNWSSIVSAGWLRDQTTIESPDLTALPGFDPAWAFPEWSGTKVSLIATTSNLGMQALWSGRDPLRPGDTLTVSGKTIELPPARPVSPP